MHAAEPFLDALARGAVGDAHQLLLDGAYVDDPRAGRISGDDALARWLADAHAWLARLGAHAEPIRTTVAGRLACVERLFHVRVAGEGRQLPLALVAETGRAGLLSAVRLYYSLWPVEQRHLRRAPLLPARPGLPLAPVMDAYQRALAAGDVDGVLACYERRGATVLEPAGEPWVHRGPRGLRRFYGSAFCYGGGLPLERGDAVDDGVACALEYTIARWGQREMPPQAGLAVCERGPSGLIRATRLYDDVEPPRE